MTTVLCVNCGSSSVKAALITGEPGDAPAELRRLARLEVDGIGTATPHLRLDDGDPDPVHVDDHADGTQQVLATIDQLDVPAPDVVGHRVVHGGPRLIEPVVLDAAVRAELEALVPFAPLHLPSELAAIAAVSAQRPDLPQVACFDTAFHATLPEPAWQPPLPRWTVDAGVRRYGFHGLSYEWAVASLGAATLGRAVIAHLGNGSSLAAVLDGRCVDTTMGLTPTGGLVMGTRTGDLDPGVLLHLQRAHHLSTDELAHLVDHESGLLGLSGRSSDMRDLLALAEAGDDLAELAVDVYCRQVAKHIAAMTTAIGGLDTLVFTAGIGERSAPVRARIASRLAHLGVALDEHANRAGHAVVSSPGAPATVRVHPADEERVVAHHAMHLGASPIDAP